MAKTIRACGVVEFFFLPDVSLITHKASFHFLKKKHSSVKCYVFASNYNLNKNWNHVVVTKAV